MLVTVPFLLLLLDVWPLRRLSSVEVFDLRCFYRLLLEKVPFFALTIASLVPALALPGRRRAVAQLPTAPQHPATPQAEPNPETAAARR